MILPFPKQRVLIFLENIIHPINYSCVALSLTCYDVIYVYVSETHFCGIPYDNGGEGVAFILKGLIYCLLLIFAGIFKGPWSS